MLNREEILEKAYNDCLKEMYAKSQPSAKWDIILEAYKEGIIGKNEKIYERHYLSQDEFLYIRDKYKKAYGIKDHWKDDVEVVEDYLNKGGFKSAYIPEEIDEDGFKHPGYRCAEKVPPIKELILNYLNEHPEQSTNEETANNITKIVMDTIKECKNFYKLNREEEWFDCNIALGASPNCNKETVKKWWKENKNKDITIEERNPILFWYRDNEYTDDEMEFEFGSKNWKEIVDKEWEDEKAEKKRKNDELIAELKKKLEEKEDE